MFSVGKRYQEFSLGAEDHLEQLAHDDPETAKDIAY